MPGWLYSVSSTPVAPAPALAKRRRDVPLLDSVADAAGSAASACGAGAAVSDWLG